MSDKAKLPTFEEFCATRERTTYRALIASGNTIASDFIGFNPRTDSESAYAHLLEGEVLAYSYASPGSPNVFIDCLDPDRGKGPYELDVGGGLYRAGTEDQLPELERRLYDWCIAEVHVA